MASQIIPRIEENQNPEAGKAKNDAAVEEKKPVHLTLKSSDGQEFSISFSAAAFSETLKNVVEDDCASSVIPLPRVDGGTLDKIVIYLNNLVNVAKNPDGKKNLDEEFLGTEEMRTLFEIILAANYLNIKELLEAVGQKIADRMENKSVEWVRKMFNVENDFTEEEEKRIRDEYPWAHEDVDPDA